MLEQIIYAVNDLWKKRHAMVLFSVQLIFVMIFLVFTFTQYDEAKAKNEYYKEIHSDNLVFFKSINLMDTPINDSYYNKYLAELLDEDCFVVIPYSFHGYENFTSIIVIGNFNELYGLEFKESNKPDVYIGLEVNQLKPGDLFQLGNKKLYDAIITGYLPKNGYYLIDNVLKNFNKSIIINLSINNFEEYFFPENIESFFHMINPNPDRISKFLKVTGEYGKTLIPNSINEFASEANINYMHDGLYSFLLFLITFGFLVINVMFNLKILINSNLREYSIHILFGAMFKHILLRTYFTCLVVVLIPWLFITMEL